jgi:Ulp1 family protease
MLVTVKTSKRHWYLIVIDFKNKDTVTCDSHESKATWNTTTPTMQKTHSTLMRWLKKRNEDIHKIRFPTEDWKLMSSFTCMGHTPQQGTPNDAGVDCGFFTLAFAMDISLGRTQFSFGQKDIPVIRNWMTHTIVSYEIQNDTYDLRRFPTQQDGGQRPLDKNKRRTRGEGGSKQKLSKQEPAWTIPGDPPPRGIVNPGRR